MIHLPWPQISGEIAGGLVGGLYAVLRGARAKRVCPVAAGNHSAMEDHRCEWALHPELAARTAALKKKINPTRVPIEKKESIRWLENVQPSTELLGDPGRCVHIGDRESKAAARRSFDGRAG
jgi:hypothetical protein